MPPRKKTAPPKPAAIAETPNKRGPKFRVPVDRFEVARVRALLDKHGGNLTLVGAEISKGGISRQATANRVEKLGLTDYARKVRGKAGAPGPRNGQDVKEDREAMQVDLARLEAALLASKGHVAPAARSVGIASPVFTARIASLREALR